MKNKSTQDPTMSYFLYAGLAIAAIAVISGKLILLIGALLASYPALLLYYKQNGDL